MRPSHWTATNEVEHWVWESYGRALRIWLASLPIDHPAHDMDDSEQASAFLAVNVDWEIHPDTPHGLDGTHVRELRLLET